MVQGVGRKVISKGGQLNRFGSGRLFPGTRLVRPMMTSSFANPGWAGHQRAEEADQLRVIFPGNGARPDELQAPIANLLPDRAERNVNEAEGEPGAAPIMELERRGEQDNNMPPRADDIVDHEIYNVADEALTEQQKIQRRIDVLTNEIENLHFFQLWARIEKGAELRTLENLQPTITRLENENLLSRQEERLSDEERIRRVIERLKGRGQSNRAAHMEDYLEQCERDNSTPNMETLMTMTTRTIGRLQSALDEVKVSLRLSRSRENKLEREIEQLKFNLAEYRDSLISQGHALARLTQIVEGNERRASRHLAASSNTGLSAPMYESDDDLLIREDGSLHMGPAEDFHPGREGWDSDYEWDDRSEGNEGPAPAAKPMMGAHKAAEVAIANQNSREGARSHSY
jgi:hypothetical protein